MNVGLDTCANVCTPWRCQRHCVTLAFTAVQGSSVTPSAPRVKIGESAGKCS